MTREIKQRFTIQQKGLDAFVKVMKIYPVSYQQTPDGG
jgi:hypothetical protein